MKVTTEYDNHHHLLLSINRNYKCEGVLNSVTQYYYLLTIRHYAYYYDDYDLSGITIVSMYYVMIFYVTMTHGVIYELYT